LECELLAWTINPFQGPQMMICGLFSWCGEIAVKVSRIKRTARNADVLHIKAVNSRLT